MKLNSFIKVETSHGWLSIEEAVTEEVTKSQQRELYQVNISIDISFKKSGNKIRTIFTGKVDSPQAPVKVCAGGHWMDLILLPYKTSIPRPGSTLR